LIEVNLLPGGKKRRGGGGGLSIPMPDFSKIPMDPYSLGAGVATVAAVVLIAWMYLGIRSDRQEVQLALEDARADSASFADVISRNQAMQARRDSVAEKVSIIQEIDANRYVWPHIMDEVARALPDYTWMISLIQTSIGEQVQFEIRGRAGNLFAMTTFMENLEASPFIRSVRPLQSDQVLATSEDGVQQQVFDFQFEMEWEEPSPDILTTIPLFANQSAGQAQAQTEADTTAAGSGGEG